MLWLLIFIPPLWPLLLLLLLFSSRRANRRTAAATERIAAVIAPPPQVRRTWAQSPFVQIPAYMILIAVICYVAKILQ